jgi:hypothetical protein
MQDSKTLVAACLLRAGFRVHGGGLSPLRDFAPDKAGWIADPTAGRQVESRLAAVPGRLFADIPVAMAFRLRRADGGGHP